MKRVCVFCGANTGLRPSYAAAAGDLGRHLARAGIGLVYGGGNVGLMGAVADGALAQGGEVIGVIPRQLVERELAHREATVMHVVGSMHERKALMADLSDAFVALPGGYGTLDEFFEILTWAQLGIHGKPCGLLNVEGYFDDLLRFLDRAVTDGLLQAGNRNLFVVGTEPEKLVSQLRAAGRGVAMDSGDFR